MKRVLNFSPEDLDGLDARFVPEPIEATPPPPTPEPAPPEPPDTRLEDAHRVLGEMIESGLTHQAEVIATALRELAKPRPPLAYRHTIRRDRDGNIESVESQPIVK